MEEETILIADDEERIRKLLKDFLIREKYRVIEVCLTWLSLICFY